MRYPLSRNGLSVGIGSVVSARGVPSGPTITYATLNPLDKNSFMALSGGDLTATSTSGSPLNIAGRSTIGKSAGKWYWEMTENVVGSLRPGTGVANLTFDVTRVDNFAYLGADTNSWGWAAPFGNKYFANTPTAYGTPPVNGTNIGVALDMDAGTITMYRENVSQGVMYSGLTGSLYAACDIYEIAGSCTFNFGATAFKYTPPVGYNAGLYT